MTGRGKRGGNGERVSNKGGEEKESKLGRIQRQNKNKG